MALSVSGFPEPANTDPQDDSYKLMNSPRLRSLFGKKPDSRYRDTDQDTPSTGTPSAAATPPSTPPTNHSLPSFIEQTYMPPPEEFVQLHMPVPLERGMVPKRPQPLPPIPIPIPIPRRATASPARLQPSLTRLDIGAISSKQHQHSLPKPPPPTVVVEEWTRLDKGKGVAIPPPADACSPPRPLPHPPLPPEPRQHVNAVAGPSRLPHSPQQKHQGVASGSGSGSGSSMRARSHSRSRMGTQGMISVGMRYQAMSVEPSEKQGIVAQGASSSSTSTASGASSGASASVSASASASSSGSGAASGSTSTSTSASYAAAAAATSPIRPLPTLPAMIAPTPVSAILRTAPVAGPSKYPSAPPPRIKRPRTSTGIPQVNSRSVFDASRPIDLNASVLAPSRPIHFPHKPILQQQRPEIRIRTNTRPRREHSADSYLGSSPPPRIKVNNLGLGGRGQRTLPSPVIGARPMPGRSATMESLSPRSAPATPPKLTILTASAGRRAPRSPPSSSTASATTKSSAATSATKDLSAYTTPATAITTAAAEDDSKELDDEPLLRYPASITDHPITTEPEQQQEEEILDSPLEVYIDDMDTTSFSRSPSPITYARPNSRGTVVSSDEEEEELGSSPTTTRQRRQPRSYRNSYRHPKPATPSLSRSPSPIMYARRASVEEEMSPIEKRRTQPRSFQFEHRGTPPGSRPASLERKSRSRQVVVGLRGFNKDAKEGKDKEGGKGGKSKSRSPRRKFRSVPNPVPPPPPPSGKGLEYEPFVLDISSRPTVVGRGSGESGSSKSAASGGSLNNSYNSNSNGNFAEKERKRKGQTSVMPHRRVVSAVSVNESQVQLQAQNQAQFDPYVHGASCGIGMLRSAEVSNSSGISSVSGPAPAPPPHASAAYRVGNSSGSSIGSRAGKEDKGKRMTQAQSVQMQYQMQQLQYLQHEKALQELPRVPQQHNHNQQNQQQSQQQQQQRQRVNSTTAYEEFFSTLRRKEQKVKDDIALVDVRVDREVPVVLGALQRKDGWKEGELKGVLKNKRSR